jgi:hypothetical protein
VVVITDREELDEQIERVFLAAGEKIHRSSSGRDLMAQLALHRMDLVISDEPLTNRLSVKAFNHKLGSSHMTFFAAPALAAPEVGQPSTPAPPVPAAAARTTSAPASARSGVDSR